MYHSGYSQCDHVPAVKPSKATRQDMDKSSFEMAENALVRRRIGQTQEWIGYASGEELT